MQTGDEVSQCAAGAWAMKSVHHRSSEVPRAHHGITESESIGPSAGRGVQTQILQAFQKEGIDVCTQKEISG